MLTIKLYGRLVDGIVGGEAKTSEIADKAIAKEKIIGCESVEILRHRPGEMADIIAKDQDGRAQMFYLASAFKARPEGFAPDVEFWDCAFIENAHGATTESVRF